VASRLLKICIISAQASAQVWQGGISQPSKQCVARPDDAKALDYEAWISAYRSSFQGNLLSITVIDGDDLLPRPGKIPVSCRITTTDSVSADGTESMSRMTPFAVQGGGPDRLPAELFKALQRQVASLREHMPDDHGQLPPAGRRMVVQVMDGGRIQSRVYDRADIPNQILEILGEFGATHGPLTMDFAPTRTGTPAEFVNQSIPADTLGIRMPQPNDPVTNAQRADTVTLAISPDHTLTVKRHLPYDNKLVVTDAKTSQVVFEERETALHGRWIYFSYARFTPDGRFLLVGTNLPAISFYDTNAWQKVNTLPGLPADAVAYYASGDWKRGLVVSHTGEVDLWDATTGHTVAALDPDGEVQSVAFSPDDSVFAVSSIRQNKNQSSTFHLRIWETSTGRFLRELPSIFYFQHDIIGDPMWWENGKYLLAETRESRFGRYIIGIWNVDAGKFRGELSGCEYSNDPYDVALRGQRLFEWCRDGKLLMWDAGAAIQHIGQFEESLRGH